MNGENEVKRLPPVPNFEPKNQTVGASDGFKVLAAVIGREQVLSAAATLRKYKEGKKNLETRIIENEEWYKLRHWECMRRAKNEKDGNAKSAIEPVSAWLFNSIANKHADAMDNFPAPNILPREAGDKNEAKMLSSIVPVILDQNGYEETYSNAWDDKLHSGTGVYGVFWDKSAQGGLGDIAIRCVDVLNLAWESGVEDIQVSSNFFHEELMSNEVLVGMYPELEGKLTTGGAEQTARYLYDDTVDTTGKSTVVDWYYKKASPSGKTVLHYCKYVNDTVLFATENEPEYAERGLYDHGEYPFVFDPLFRTKGTPCGFGYIDVGKSVQEYIDRGNRAIMKNMLANASPRHFSKISGGVNEAEFADTERDIVHVAGSLSDDNIRPIETKPLNSIYLNVLNAKIDELKETTGNRDISTGGTTSGVTAAAAIAAMQEAGSKLSRDANKASYRAFRKVCVLVIELIRQFYDLPRCFRITGTGGEPEFVEYSNAGIAPQMQGVTFGIDTGYRVPQFDIEVTAQKQSPYSKMAQNEFSLQLYNGGFFDPARADAALACIEMMDFDRKDFVVSRISQNGGMYQQMIKMQEQLEALMAMIQGGGKPGQTLPVSQASPGSRPGTISPEDASSGPEAEPKHVQSARRRVAEATAPR